MQVCDSTAARPRLTGSGSGCFVEFADRESAERALDRLPTGLTAWIAAGAARSPLLEALESEAGNRESGIGNR